MVSDERALATWLSGRDDADLAAVFAARGVSPSAAWSDFFDAAAALLDPTSLDRVITRLPRATLVALAAGDADAGIPQSLALLDGDGHPYAAVTARLDTLATANPLAFVPDTSTAEPHATGAEAAAAERAFATSGALADVLLACLHVPLSRTGTGAISAHDRKRLIESGAVASADELDDLVASAVGAGLAQSVDREWVVTEAGERWLETPTVERWRTIVAGFLDALPTGLRSADGRIVGTALWPGAYPLDPEWADRAQRIGRIAVRWGLLAEDGTEPSWSTAIRSGGEPDTAAFAAELPAEIDKVYLQADLTAIAPGPLAPFLDLRLRRIAARESRAQASTYRFTGASLAAGMTEGESAGSIRAFLSELSLSGIPQPLDYLIESTASRHGLVRVSADAVSGHTRVESPDPGMLNAVSVDQSLRPLGLVADGASLTSRVARDPVYWALADARYPVVALAVSGEPEPLHRRTPAPAPTRLVAPIDAYGGLLATLRASGGGDGDAAWLDRELDQAVRSRGTIVVVVRLPDGTERTFTLEASGLGGGRLRGRDRAADIERTLPVSHIVSVRPA